MEELLFVYDATIEGWMRALGLKDKATEGHSYRLTELSLALAREMDFEGQDLTRLHRGALLHDIGKFGVPDVILNKPNKLTEKEWKLMRLHPEFGYEILAPIPFLQTAAEIAHYHHENWDGSGYPRGLIGENIPILARIVAVCNVFDALVSDQPYRYGWSEKDALSYIEAHAGKQFDPAVVKAFLRFKTHEN
jgi:putative two-component system response regulator